MNNKKQIKNEILTGERALFAGRDLYVTDSIFADGESPLKESSDITLEGCLFKWKYPIWYSKNISLKNCSLYEMARAGMWYDENLMFDGCVIEAPKGFRRCKGVTLRDTSFSNAAETLWHCSDITLESVVAKGDYFAMDSEGIKADRLTLYGNYSFDGVKNVEITNSKLMTKDAFWNSENVTVKNSFISGEYLGWNAKNLTLIDCTIDSLQGLCYIENLVMRNCKLLNTTLAFEYSSVDAEIDGSIASVINPTSGRISADSIGELILERDRVDPDKTKIIVRN